MKTVMKPLFTIVTVTYNAAATVGRTIESVAAQTCRLYEHLVIDGASKDDTLRVVTSVGNPLVTVRSEPDEGLYDAMNKAIGMAAGDYLIFLNAGDKFHTEHTLQDIADAIMANDYPGVVYGQTDIVDDSGAYLRPRHLTAPDRLTMKSFADGMVVCHQAFVVLRRIAGYYNRSFRYSADYEWCIRCLMHSRCNVLIDDVLVDYLNEGLTTANHRASLLERFRIMCYYYGFWPTLARHVKFFVRNALRHH